METVLHKATLDDASVLAEMNQMLIDDEGSVNPMSLDQLKTRIHRWLESGEYEAVILSRNDETVGYVLYRQERNEYDIDELNIYVRQFFVNRAYRRRGIGRAAFEQVVSDYFPPQATIVLEVLASNLQGRSFWERLGFEPYYTAYRRPARITEPSDPV